MALHQIDNTFSRKRWGRGFQYFDAKHEKVQCTKLLKYFSNMAIPPMWQKVVIMGDPKAKIQATGRDAKNRKQYIYNQTWQKKQQQKKFAQMIKFANQLPLMRRHCTKLLSNFESSKDHVLALMVLILDETGIRIGNQRYTQSNETFGLSTLRRKHLVESNDALTFEFTGKSSKARTVMIEDDALVMHIKKCAESPGYNIFRFQETSRQWIDLSSDDVNVYIRSIMGRGYSAKNFRTWHATCLAVEAYQQLYPFTQSKSKPVNQVIKQVSTQLGNTMKICREYYIHPRILKLIEQNELHNKFAELDKVADPQLQLDPIELATLKWLS